MIKYFFQQYLISALSQGTPYDRMYPHTPEVSQMVFSMLLKPFVKRTRTDRHTRHAHWSFFISKDVTLNVIICADSTLTAKNKRDSVKQISAMTFHVTTRYPTLQANLLK